METSSLEEAIRAVELQRLRACHNLDGFWQSLFGLYQDAGLHVG